MNCIVMNNWRFILKTLLVLCCLMIVYGIFVYFGGRYENTFIGHFKGEDQWKHAWTVECPGWTAVKKDIKFRCHENATQKEMEMRYSSDEGYTWQVVQGSAARVRPATHDFDIKTKFRVGPWYEGHSSNRPNDKRDKIIVIQFFIILSLGCACAALIGLLNRGK